MNYTMFFPIGLILLSLFAAIVYAVGGQYLKATYWFAAAVISLSVTLMGE